MCNKNPEDAHPGQNTQRHRAVLVMGAGDMGSLDVPDGEGVRAAGPLTVQEAAFQRGAQRGRIQFRADEHQFLCVLLGQFRVVHTGRLEAGDAARLGPQPRHPGASGQREEALAAQHPAELAAVEPLGDQLPEPARVEGPLGTEQGGRDAVLLRLRDVLTVELPYPARGQLRSFDVVAAGPEHLAGGYPSAYGVQQPCARIEPGQDAAQPIGRRVVDEIELVQDDHIGELDLVDEQIAHGALVVLVRREAAGGEVVAGAQFAEEARRVHHGDHGVEPGEVVERRSVVACEGEGRGHRHGFGDAARLDQEVVEPALQGEAFHLFEEIVPERAADAAIGHLDQPLLRTGERGLAPAHQRGIDVDLAHVVHDHGDPQSLAVRQQMVEQGGLARAEEAGQDGHRQAVAR